MGIVAITTDLPGQIGDAPRRLKIISTDNLATVTTAGYLNPASLQGYVIFNTDIIDMWYGATTGANLTIVTPGTFGSFTTSISNGVITLVAAINPGDVLLPVIANHFAIFNGTTGQIKSDAATAINSGNIQAGLSGTAGTVASFPGTAANGSFIFKAINNTGAFNSTFSNSNIGQATVYSLPDSGTATTTVLITDSAGTQTISTGSLALALGSFTATQGNITAGSSGHAGFFTSFPGTAANGSFLFKAVNNAGNFASTLSNSNIAQATVYSLPDTTTATANVLATGSALVNGNLVKASGTAGAVVDAGISTLNVTTTQVFTLGFAALATAGKVNIKVHTSGTSQYFIQDIKVLTSTGLSGGGGNRLLSVSDGTIVFNNAGITAALLGTPIFTLWGGTGNPVAVGTSQVSTAGADIFFQYAGGTTDYTAGSIQVAITFVQVTA